MLLQCVARVLPPIPRSCAWVPSSNKPAVAVEARIKEEHLWCDVIGSVKEESRLHTAGFCGWGFRWMDFVRKSQQGCAFSLQVDFTVWRHGWLFVYKTLSDFSQNVTRGLIDNKLVWHPECNPGYNGFSYGVCAPTSAARPLSWVHIHWKEEYIFQVARGQVHQGARACWNGDEKIDMSCRS